MAENSKIEWTDHTLNPWIGCTKVSPGCDGCYAEALMDKRYHKVQWGAGQPRVRTSEANWRMPIKWDKAAAAAGRRDRVFCASLADVFDNEVPPQWRGELWKLVRETPNLDWLILTKRIGNARGMLPADWFDGYPNVWIGATIVNQEEADRDIPKLLAVPARVRFLSIEPMLGPVRIFHEGGDPHPIQMERGVVYPAGGLSWVIVGGESGPKARPMHPDWARSLRDQCNAAGVPFFFKQWGEWLPAETDRPGDGEYYAVADDGSDREITGRATLLTQHGQEFLKVGKSRAGRLLDGRTHDDVPT